MTKIRRISAVALVAVMLLVGCTDADSDGVYRKYSDIDYSDTYVPGQDSQEYLYEDNFMCYGENDDAGFVSTMMSEFIYVVDKKTLTYSPLCSKPDCLHDRETTYEKKEGMRSILRRA